MMPMEPAKEVRMVRAFLVLRLLKLRERAVRKDMDVRPMFLCSGSSSSLSSTSKGSESSRIFPSRRRTMRVAYSWASSGLWVTMTTSRSLATSRRRSMTCTLVSLSRAPVGSSASRMSGLFTRALAMATRCICPPESWFGFLWSCSPNPTMARASSALCRRSALPMPDMVRASSTLARMV